MSFLTDPIRVIVPHHFFRGSTPIRDIIFSGAREWLLGCRLRNFDSSMENCYNAKGKGDSPNYASIVLTSLILFTI
jgi:hypothetical protein